jgi:photosystem II stability/assembly factor-like uncharacterized protein
MKKRLLIVAAILIIGVLGIIKIQDKQNLIASKNEIVNIKNSHKKFLKNSPFKEVSLLSKKERKAQGLPPNKYLEREWELTMNPETGRPTFENLSEIKNSVAEARLLDIAAGRISGDASDNSWVERGPNNVGGRTKAIMFDPNDVTNETVFAGGVSGGLWKNTNISSATSQWTQVVISDNLNVSSIVADPNDSMIFYLGTGESYTGGDASGNGIWKSEDGGTSWAKVFGGITGPTNFVSSGGINVNSPNNILGEYASIPAGFGGEITTPITANVILADDGVSPNDDGCTAFTNGASVSGKIALIKRGSCPFVDKVLGAQNAGAIAVIMVNNVDGTPITMGGTNTSITIPSIMISKSDGAILEAELLNTLNVTLNVPTGNYNGNLVPGAQHVNDLVTRVNNGITEIYAAVGANYYAGAYLGGDSYGVYKSDDDGASWSKLSLPLISVGEEYTPMDIAIAADNKVWVSTTRDRITGNGGGKVFASTDVNGVTFQDKYTVANGVRVQIAASSLNAGTLYVLAQGSTAAAPVIMVKTTNGFDTTTSMTLPSDVDSGIPANDFTRGQAFYDLAISVDPLDDSNLYTGGIDLFKSSDSGSSWTQISKWSNNNFLSGLSVDLVHADQHAIAFSNIDPNKMLFGNDGGVYYSSNGGTDIVSRNLGYNTSQFYSIGVAPSSSGGENFAGGLQDNGTQGFNNASPGINSSSTTQGGDGAATDYDQGGDNYYISNYVYNGSINKRNLNGSFIKTINSESGSFGDFINQQDLDSNQDLLYTNYTDGSGPIYQIAKYNTGTGAVNKAIFTDALLTSSPTALKVSPYTTTSSKLYVGTQLGDLLVVNNANFANAFSLWSDISGPNFLGSVSDIEFGSNEDQIFVTLQNYGVKSIWYTNDGGQTWDDKEGDLPDMPVKCILQNPLNTEEVIVGTELGVWYTNNFSDNSPSWLSAFNGMSNVKVTDLDMRDDFKVYASSYGRGVFTGEFTAVALSVVENEIASNTVSLYPTITSGELFIKSMVNYPETKVSVYDMNGRLTSESSMNLYSNEEFSFNISELSSGMYFVNISSDNLNKTVKIIVN